MYMAKDVLINSVALIRILGPADHRAKVGLAWFYNNFFRSVAMFYVIKWTDSRYPTQKRDLLMCKKAGSFVTVASFLNTCVFFIVSEWRACL